MSIKVSVTSDKGTGKSEIHKVDFLELQGLIVKNEIAERRSEYSRAVPLWAHVVGICGGGRSGRRRDITENDGFDCQRLPLRLGNTTKTRKVEGGFLLILGVEDMEMAPRALEQRVVSLEKVTSSPI